MAPNLDNNPCLPSALPAGAFEIITALRYDELLSQSILNTSCNATDPLSSRLYMLPRHKYRMLAATKDFQWSDALRRTIHDLEDQIRIHLESTYNGKPTEPLKVRAALSSIGILNITSTKVPSVPPFCLFPKSLLDVISFDSPATFHILISMVPITPTLFTKHKTTSRAQYDDARSQVTPLIKQSEGKSTSLPIEVLLCNNAGVIMEGSITTPYFNRDGYWITPSAECGGNLGTTRQYALDNGLCREGIVERSTVKVGEMVVLSNGVRGFGWGIIEEIQGM